MNQQAHFETLIRGKQLVAARVIWAAVFLLCAAVLALALPARFAQLRSPQDEVSEGMLALGFSEEIVQQFGTEAAMRAVLAELGIPEAGYIEVTVALEGGVALLYIAIALIIFWRKSDSPMGLFSSLFLITFGVGGTSFTLLPLQVSHQAGFLLVGVVVTLAYSAFPPFFLLFPDGRWVPRWGWVLAAAWGVTTFFWNLFPGSPVNPTTWPIPVFSLYLAVIWGFPVFAQIHRYRRRSNAVQRQQTKWLVFGFAAMVLIIFPPYLFLPGLLSGVAPETVYSILNPLQTLSISIIPIALAISILHYRLWDIDILIRRTLQYALLTGILALTYFGGVVILQGILRPLTGSGNSPIVTVITTLGIAALFTPLRRRIQGFIDRRFFRKKYDSEKALTRFSAAARDEVNMDILTAKLISVIDETLQPEEINLWIKK